MASLRHEHHALIAEVRRMVDELLERERNLALPHTCITDGM
jgi:hypothetical protein